MFLLQILSLATVGDGLKLQQMLRLELSAFDSTSVARAAKVRRKADKHMLEAKLLRNS